MDDIFVTLEANIIESVKKLVQNARLEFNARAQKGKIASSPSSNKGSASASMKVSLPAKTRTQPAAGETATPKKEVSKEPATDAFATVVPPSEEQPPSDTPALTQSSSTEGGEAAVDATVTPAPEPVALTPEEEAKKQLDDLAADVDSDLHLMAHMRKPAMTRRRTHAGTSSRFDPNAPALPEPAVVALVPEPEPERVLTRATSASMAGPRQPMVNLADLQLKRGGGRGGGPGRGGMAGRPVDSLPASIADHNSPMRRQTAVDSSRPRPAPEIHRPPPALETHKSVEAAQPAPPEPAKSPDEAFAPESEAPPLPSLPVSPLRTPTIDAVEPDLLSLDVGSAKPADAPPGPKSPAGPRPPGGSRSPHPGPAPPPGHHVPGPAPPSRVLSPGRKVSSSGPPPHTPMSPTFSPLEVQVDGDYPPPLPVSTPSAEGDSEAEREPERKMSVVNHGRPKQPMINLADITKPRTPKPVDSARASPAAAAGPTIPKCAECGCTKFVMNPFKKGTNCSTCFHQHPAA